MKVTATRRDDEIFENLVVWKSMMLWFEASGAASGGGFPI